MPEKKKMFILDYYGCINKESSFKLLQSKKLSSVNYLPKSTFFIDNLEEKGLLLLQESF